MAPSPTLAAVTACFDGLRNKNADDVPFAPDVRFESPLSDPNPGCRGGPRVPEGGLPGEYVAVRFELETVYGVIPAFDWFHVVDGAIAAARPYYDPRPITAAAEAAR